MISRRALLTSFALSPFAVNPFLRAQQQTSSPQTGTQPPTAAQPPTIQPPSPQQSDKVFTGGVKVVNVFATVRDKKNQIAKDLTQDDFTIDEDGRPQTIRYFAKESNLPMTLGLLVDTSGSMRRMIETERGASFKFLDQVLREDKDVAFLIHFDYEVELLQDLTPSRKLLQTALSQLAPSADPQLQQRGQQNPYPGSGGGGGGRQHRGTALFDAILLASNELMKKQTGRKAIILLTDGDDSGSKSTMTEAISAAQRADAQCYAVRFADESSNPNRFGGFSGPGMGRRNGGGRPPTQDSRGDGKKVLERIAKETGGGYFEGGKKESLDDIYRQIQEELRNQYSLGYTPDKDTGPGYRAVRVLTKNKNLVVQSRDGYYADK
jgi:VWFA-related protein